MRYSHYDADVFWFFIHMPTGINTLENPQPLKFVAWGLPQTFIAVRQYWQDAANILGKKNGLTPFFHSVDARVAKLDMSDPDDTNEANFYQLLASIVLKTWDTRFILHTISGVNFDDETPEESVIREKVSKTLNHIRGMFNTMRTLRDKMHLIGAWDDVLTLLEEWTMGEVSHIFDGYIEELASKQDTMATINP